MKIKIKRKITKRKIKRVKNKFHTYIIIVYFNYIINKSFILIFKLIFLDKYI